MGGRAPVRANPPHPTHPTHPSEHGLLRAAAPRQHRLAGRLVGLHQLFDRVAPPAGSGASRHARSVSHLTTGAWAGLRPSRDLAQPAEHLSGPGGQQQPRRPGGSHYAGKRGGAGGGGSRPGSSAACQQAAGGGGGAPVHVCEAVDKLPAEGALQAGIGLQDRSGACNPGQPQNVTGAQARGGQGMPPRWNLEHGRRARK